MPTGLLQGLTLLGGRPGPSGPEEGEGADFFLFLVGRGVRDPGLRGVSVLSGIRFPELRLGRGRFRSDPGGGALSSAGRLWPVGAESGGSAGPLELP